MNVTDADLAPFFAAARRALNDIGHFRPLSSPAKGLLRAISDADSPDTTHGPRAIRDAIKAGIAAVLEARDHR